MTKDEALTLALDAFLRIESCECTRAQEKAITAIKQALAQPEHERNFCPRCGKRLGSNDWDVHTCTQPQRKPLTDEQLDVLAFDSGGLPNSHLEFARAIEAAHGIKE